MNVDGVEYIEVDWETYYDKKRKGITYTPINENTRYYIENIKNIEKSGKSKTFKFNIDSGIFGDTDFRFAVVISEAPSSNSPIIRVLASNAIPEDIYYIFVCKKLIFDFK